MLVIERVLEILIREFLELIEHMIEPLVADRVQPHWGRGHWREADFIETHLFGEVVKNCLHIDDLSCERDSRSDWPRAVDLDQLLDLWRDHVIAAFAVLEDAELIVRFFWSVDADRHSDVILRQEIYYLRVEHCRVRGHAEVDVFAHLRGFLSRVFDR